MTVKPNANSNRCGEENNEAYNTRNASVATLGVKTDVEGTSRIEPECDASEREPTQSEATRVVKDLEYHLEQTFGHSDARPWCRLTPALSGQRRAARNLRMQIA